MNPVVITGMMTAATELLSALRQAKTATRGHRIPEAIKRRFRAEMALAADDFDLEILDEIRRREREAMREGSASDG